MSVEDTGTSRGVFFLQALRAAMGRTPIWLLCWFMMLLLAAVATQPWVEWFGATTANRYAPGALMGGLDEAFRQDHRESLAALRNSTGYAAAALGLIAMLAGVYSAGGWLQIFLERTAGHSVRRFFWGGSRYFWRFIRVWLLSIVALAAVAYLCSGWPWRRLVMGVVLGAPEGDAEVFSSERNAVFVEWLQSGLYAGLFALVLAWGDYTRARVAMHDSRSALLAGLATCGLFLRHPLRVLRPLALLFLVEVGILWCLGSVSWGISGGLEGGGSWYHVALLFFIGQLAIIWRVITRGARYHAAVQVSRGLVPPLSRPDPWAHRVGGPGGPQYPIDSGDEYGVSM